MKRYLRLLSPENNRKTRAIFYVIGGGGILHLISLFILAVIHRKAAYFNPLYTVDIDQLWPAARNNFAVYVLGWVFFVLLIIAVYKLILKKR